MKASCDYQAELNEQQYAAVSSTARHSLIIAGAGSGKTRTLTYRVSWLIDQGIAPWRILLLTFTNKAAKEMLSRVQELTQIGPRQIWGGTFHSIANRILRRHAELLGYERGFSILDSDDQAALIKNIVKRQPINHLSEKNKKLFPKASVLLSLHSLAVNRGLAWQDILLEEYGHLDIYQEEIAAIFASYKQRKKEAQSMDFDDLLLQVIRLLEEHPELCREYQSQFQHILVDEYQDTNAPQERIIALLSSGENSSLMVVGDDAQSIYSWRGANVEHILEFQERYPDAALYKIETNYRSVPAILELSNAAIAQNSRQYAKELRSHRPHSSMLPIVIPLPDKKSEAHFIATRIDELMGEGHYRGKDIAVLYRAHFHSMDIQMELTRQRIPFRITSGVRFFEQAHVKDLVAYLRLLVNPRDEMALLRLLTMFPRVGPATAQKIQYAWQAELDRLGLSSLRGCFYNSMAQLSAVSATLRPLWQETLSLLDSLEQAEEDHFSPQKLIDPLTAQLIPYIRSSYEHPDERIDDLQQMASISTEAESLDDYLAEIALLSQLDQNNNSDNPVDDADTVTLSTIHQAKGLEWKIIFVSSLSDGLFPHRKIIERGDIDGMEEETRLFYVAVTRAEDQLYLLYPRYSGGYDGQYCPPSRFLTNLPPETMDAWDMYS